MNIFIFDLDFDLCAQYHCDKYVVKMTLETTQLLNNALIANNPNYPPVYRQSHKNHPASLWAGKSKENFEWLNDLGLALCKEYTYRYEKRHKCQDHLEHFKESSWKDMIPSLGLTPFALCMPDHYKTEDPVESYRNYYRGAKADIAKWSKRKVPDWWYK